MAQNVAQLQQHLSPPTKAGSQATQIEQSRAIAEVKAMVTVAQMMPRSEADAIERIKEACGQMRLAERSFFKFSRGGSTVAGSTIHLAADIARCWGNIDYGVKELARDDIAGHSEMVAFAWDLQTNVRAETSFIVPHKRDKKDGPVALIDMRDIYENNANNGARRLREMLFRVIPPHIKSMAEELCRETLQRGTSTEPLAKQIADIIEALAGFGIHKGRIEAKLGLAVDAMTPVDLANLRVSFFSLRRQEVTAEEEFPSVTASSLNQALQAPVKAEPVAEQPKQDAPAPEQSQDGDLLAQPDPNLFHWRTADGVAASVSKPSEWIETATTRLQAEFDAGRKVMETWAPNAEEWKRVQKALPPTAKARQAVDALHLKLDELAEKQKGAPA